MSKLCFLALFLSISITVFSQDVDTVKNKSAGKNQLSKAKAKENTRYKSYIITSQRNQRITASLKEGYTSSGSQYYIKSVLVRGRINFISVTNGIALASYQSSGGDSNTFYYLQKEGRENNYREIFFKKKTSDTVFGLSKAVLIEAIGDDSEILAKINVLKKITSNGVKKLVKEYNSKHQL